VLLVGTDDDGSGRCDGCSCGRSGSWSRTGCCCSRNPHDERQGTGAGQEDDRLLDGSASCGICVGRSRSEEEDDDVEGVLVTGVGVLGSWVVLVTVGEE